MKRLHPGSVLAAAMGMTPPTLSSHVERGTVTEPTAMIDRFTASEYAWDNASVPTLSALGFSALVPAADDVALVDLTDRSQYVCPARSNGHLGRYDEVSHLGFVRNSKIAFHQVVDIVRIGYLDPVRWIEEKTAAGLVPVDSAARFISDSELDDGAKQILKEAVDARSNFHRSADGSQDHLSDNPLELAVYVVDPQPVVSDVTTTQIVRRYRFTTDEITTGMSMVALASLNDLARAAKGSRRTGTHTTP